MVQCMQICKAYMQSVYAYLTVCGQNRNRNGIGAHDQAIERALALEVPYRSYSEGCRPSCCATSLIGTASNAWSQSKSISACSRHVKFVI